MFTDDFHFSYFSQRHNIYRGNPVTLEMLLSLIENPNKPENTIIEEYRQTLDDDIKKELPLFTVHSASSIRLKYDIAEFGMLTGLMLLDLDKIPPEQIRTVHASGRVCDHGSFGAGQ